MMAGAGARVCADRKARISIQFPFPEPHPCTAAIFWGEINTCGFQGALHGLNCFRSHGSICFSSHNSQASFEASHGRNCNSRCDSKPLLCPIKQPSGGSALRRGHPRLPFALSFTPGSSPLVNSTPAFSRVEIIFVSVSGLRHVPQVSVSRGWLTTRKDIGRPATAPPSPSVMLRGRHLSNAARTFPTKAF